MSKRKAFALRINEDILRAVQRWSDDELRSVNAQIEYVLREALREAGRLKDPRPMASQEDQTADHAAIKKTDRDVSDRGDES